MKLPVFKVANTIRGARKFLSVALALVVIGFGTRIHASTLYDDFNDNTLNSSLWVQQTYGSGITVAEANQQLEISLANNASTGNPNDPLGGGYLSTNKISGDFDLTVEYQLSAWPKQNGVRVGLLVVPQEELLVPAPNVNLGWTAARVSGGTKEPFADIYVVDFGGNVTGFTPTNDLSGSLRLQRTGSTITGYYLGTTDWVQIDGGATITTDPLYFGIAAWSHDPLFSGKDVKIAFDNARVVPLPPSILLFGSSILSILLVRRKAVQPAH